jgi:4-amino-4-deoxy-L-arabinose transferase-like glycosyltransferase
MRPPRSTPPWPWIALVVVTLAMYLFGLDGAYAPTNGDEMVYIHIARMTAESGHWLPLQSEIVGMRNTKPPLLFWQAIVASDWGQNWSLWALRLPSIVYTFLTTALLAFFAHRISGNLRTACLSAVLYLLFFSTFRYGRVYLTSAPETFWLSLPMWWLLWLRLRCAPQGAWAAGGSAQVKEEPAQRAGLIDAGEQNALPPRLLASKGMGWLVFTLMGVAMALGAAYKSFALVAPAAAAVWCAWLLSAPRFQWPMALRTTLGVSWSAILAVGIFSLWLVLDPDPAAVWQEFVMGENAGKLTNTRGYWHAALFGVYPMWTQLLAYPANAGLLFFTVLGLAWVGLGRAFKRQTYAQLSPSEWILLAWLAVWLIVFTIPSQRSERYVIPAMPALAIVMALVWEKIPKAAFWATLVVMAPALVMLARIAWVMGGMQIASQIEVTMTLIAVCAGLAGATAGFIRKKWLRPATLLACLAVYASFSLMVEPLSTPATGYSAAVQNQVQGKRIAVPNGFTGQFERFHFILPMAKLVPYDADGRNTGAYQPDLPAVERLSYLLGQFDAVVWLQDDLSQPEPSCMPQCQLLGARWHVKSRHKAGEVSLGNLWQPQEWLFRHEWLVKNTTNQAVTPAK